ncbi:MAG: hypothetical protein V5A46_07155 [Haloferacaceae archaeon]
MTTSGAEIDAPAVALLVSRERLLWVVAIAFFGIGDLATTVVGLQFGRVAEVGPLTVRFVRQYGATGMLGLKALAFGCCYGLWRLTPRPYDVGVPLGLAVLGVLVTVWNLAVLLLVSV